MNPDLPRNPTVGGKPRPTSEITIQLPGGVFVGEELLHVVEALEVVVQLLGLGGGGGVDGHAHGRDIRDLGALRRSRKGLLAIDRLGQSASTNEARALTS